MARVKYDVRGVESGNRKALPPGVYNAKITQADVTKPEGKDQRIEVILEVVNSEKEHNGQKLYEYINLESQAAKWKLKEYLEAVGETSEDGSFDTDDHLNRVLGVKTIIRPADEARGFDERAAVRRMFPLDEAIRNGGSAVKENLDEPVEDEPAATAEDEPEEAEITWIELDSMDRSALKQMLKEESIEFKVTKTKSDDDIRGAIADWFEIGDRPNPYEMTKEAQEAEEEETEEEAEATPEAAEAAGDDDDYDEWTDDELREELTQRSLSTKGSKRIMMSRLRKDDAAEDKPF